MWRRRGRGCEPGEDDVYFLSGHSGFYYYLTDSVRPLRVPGNVELLRMRDMDAVLAAIRGRRIPKLVVDANFFAMDMYRPEVYAASAGGDRGELPGDGDGAGR